MVRTRRCIDCMHLSLLTVFLSSSARDIQWDFKTVQQLETDFEKRVYKETQQPVTQRSLWSEVFGRRRVECWCLLQSVEMVGGGTSNLDLLVRDLYFFLVVNLSGTCIICDYNMKTKAERSMHYEELKLSVKFIALCYKYAKGHYMWLHWEAVSHIFHDTL